MKKQMTVCAVALALAGSAWATTQKEAPNMQQGKTDGRVAQQEKMKKCNADAKGKTGDERKKFMSECLKA